MYWLRNTLLENHVEPKVINDAFSNDVFEMVLDELDPEKLYFTQADIAGLAPFRNPGASLKNGSEIFQDMASGK